jgi:hypothetical protein
MCVTKLPLTCGKPTADRLSRRPVERKTHRSYRVLRAAPPRGGPRSVDRDRAGRNAEAGVKGLSPDNQSVSWWPSLYDSGEGSTARKSGTTGVRDHGMCGRPTAERERSAGSRALANRPRLRDEGQGVNAESASTLPAEVRCPRSSEQMGQRPSDGAMPSSEGGHGE